MTATVAPLTSAELESLLPRLSVADPGLGDRGRVDRITMLERIKAAASAGQAVETDAFRVSQLAEHDGKRLPSSQRGKGIGAQVGLARHESPNKGSRLLGLATALTREMPRTLAALAAGEINEWRAALMVRETACLTLEDRARVDRELGPRLGDWGDREVVAQARRLSYELDPQSFVDRARIAESERRVTLRPAPDTMSILTGTLPVAQGVAVYAELVRAADAARATGDQRSRGQVMADTLVERVTGRAEANQSPVEVQLVMTDRALLGSSAEPVHMIGYGPVPTQWARDLVRATGADVWIRRIFTDGHQPVSLDSTRREFPGWIRRLVILRDQTCRTPYCDAPIRHIDHIVAHHAGGPTSYTNAQGLCEACNHTKQADGWRARPGPDGAGATVATTTPTGHTYTSRPPGRRKFIPLDLAWPDPRTPHRPQVA